MKYDSLRDRMKGYENAYRQYLPNRLPIIIRIDGRAFHTFTRGFSRPFDSVLMNTMQNTALKLCENIAGCKLAYTQSDEINLLITNNDCIDTQPWFDNNLQKLVSLSASIATLAFNAHYSVSLANSPEWNSSAADDDHAKWVASHLNAVNSATFDARAFILPEDEVCNYFIWRQQDAVRNSIQMVAQSLYSHKQLQNKNSNDLQEMIKAKDVNWNDYATPCKRGTCVVRKEQEVNGVIRHKWEIDRNIPTFTKDRSYINNAFVHAAM